MHRLANIPQQPRAFGRIGNRVDHQWIVVERARESNPGCGDLRFSESYDFGRHVHIFAHRALAM